LDSLNDVNIPIYKGNFEIIFTRNSDNNAIFRWKSKKPDGMKIPQPYLSKER